MSEFKKIPVILDGDPGHDDAIGWTLAQGSGRKLMQDTLHHRKFI